MKNYNIHNDLISNFFYLIKKQFTHVEYNDDGKFSIQNIRPELTDGKLYGRELELEKIIFILNLRINSSNFLKDDKVLLLSRFFYVNWRFLMKSHIEKEIKKGTELKHLKNKIVSVLKEIEYRTELKYTLEIENIFNGAINFYSTNELIKLFGNSIVEDIEWINKLNLESLKTQKIILHKNASKNNIIKVLSIFLKTNMSISKEKGYDYEKNKSQYNNDVANFINTICGYNDKLENSVNSFNLSFIPKGKDNINIINFSKIFYYAKFKGIIKSNQGEINRILSDSFNMAERYFENITKNTIEKEKTNQDFIDYVLKPFEKRSN
jgi:hypothetical protein